MMNATRATMESINKKDTRIPLLCAFVMLLALAVLLPRWARAATIVTVCGVDISTGGYYRTTPAGALEPTGTANDYNVWFDTNNNTLYLNNASIQHHGSEAINASGGNLIMVLNGSNTIFHSGTSTSIAGIRTTNMLTINGTGSLTVTATAQSNISVVRGILVSSGFTVGSGVNITCVAQVAANAQAEYTYGIYAGDFIVDGTLTTTAGKAGRSFGMYAWGNITVNGTLTAAGGEATVSSSYGVRAMKNIAVNGMLTAISGIANGNNYTLYTNGSITVDGTLIATSGTAGVHSYGVLARGSLTINTNGTLAAVGGTATSNNSYGVNVDESIAINGALVAVAGTAGNSSEGVYARNGAIAVNSGSLIGHGQSRAFSKQPVIATNYTSAWAWLGESDLALAGGGKEPSGTWYQNEKYAAIGQKPTGLSLNPYDIVLYTGETAYISPMLAAGSHSTAGVGVVAWQSNNTGIATADRLSTTNTAVIHAVAPGSTTVTAAITKADGTMEQATVTVTVYDRSTSFSLTPSITLAIGSTGTIVSKIEPSTANQSLTLTSSNTSVASIGNVTYDSQSNVSRISITAGNTTGSAIITARTWDGQLKTATCIVTDSVLPPPSASQPPKTGDNAQPSLWIALCGVSIVYVMACKMFIRRKCIAFMQNKRRQ